MNEVHNDNRTVVWLGMSTFALSMLFVWQGLDIADMGLWLTGFQQFYTHPDSMWTSCWLSFFIGHWVGMALGGGVLAYKLSFVVIVTTSAMIAYRLLASQLGNSRMLAAMVLLTVFFTRGWGGNWIDYNNLTALFYLVGAALLFFGLVDNRKLLVVSAGVVLGANLFVRFPNLLGITLMSAIWLQGWVYRRSLRDVLIVSAGFLGGFTLGIALVWGLIVLHGHETLYVQSIRAIFGFAADANSHHFGSELLKRFISDHVQAFTEALFIVVIGGVIASWASKQRNLLASLVILIVVLLLAHVNYIYDQSQWSVPGLCYIVLLSILFRDFRKDRRLALLAFIAGMVLILAPIGSNNGTRNAVFGMWLALPLTLIWLWRSFDAAFSLWFKVSGDGFEWNSNLSMEARGLRVFSIIIVLALLFQSLALAWRHTYCDSKNRYAMMHSIAHPLLAGVYTTTKKAKVVTELLDALSHFAKPGDEILAYNAIPTVHFLTQTLPWLGIAWPEVNSPEKIAALIKQKEQTGARLPSIVRATFQTYSTSWPITVERLNATVSKDEPRSVFADFEQRHGYTVAWSNGFFEILTTAQ